MTAIVRDPEKKTVADSTGSFPDIAGLSTQTRENLGRYAGGYQPSQQVYQARDYLKDVIAGKPAGYAGSYQKALNNLYDQITQRPEFSYDPGSDPLYQQYRQQYASLGRRAMMDTTAQAAALSGGYGNSYAVTAGNQAYQTYLQQLNDALPQFYQWAADRYQAEGDALNDQYDRLIQADSAEYDRYRDSVADWQADRAYASDDYWKTYSADTEDFDRMLNFYTDLGKMENSQFKSDRDYAYKQAMALIKTGQVPGSDLLNQSGITRSDAKKLAAYYGKKQSSRSGSSSRSQKSTGGSGATGSSGATTLSDYGQSLYDFLATGTGKSASASEKRSVLSGYLARGKITSSEKAAIEQKLGLKS